MTMSHGITSRLYYQGPSSNGPRSVQSTSVKRQGAFEDIGEIVELEGNEIISHGYLFLFSILFSFQRFPLTRISVSLYKNAYLHEKHQYKYTLKCKLSVLNAKMSND